MDRTGSSSQPNRDEGRLIAAWGEARLIKKWDGKCELVGGTAEDRAEARKWIALFMKWSKVEGSE